MWFVFSQVQDDHFFPMLENRRPRGCSLDVFPRLTTGHCLYLFYQAKSRRIATEDGPERDQRSGPPDPLGSRQWNQRKFNTRGSEAIQKTERPLYVLSITQRQQHNLAT